MPSPGSAVKPPKVSLYKYVTGQLDIPGIRVSMGLPPIPLRKQKLLEKYAQSQGKKPKGIEEKNAAKNTPTDEAAPAKEDKDQSKQEATLRKFTPEEDARILEWKAANEGKPWRPLGEELGKSDSALKARFKELKIAGEATEKSQEAVAVATEVKNGNGEADAGQKRGERSGGGKLILEPKEDELMRLILKEDEEEKWVRVASRIFDKTGKSFHPLDLKDKYAKG